METGQPLTEPAPGASLPLSCRAIQRPRTTEFPDARPYAKIRGASATSWASSVLKTSPSTSM